MPSWDHPPPSRAPQSRNRRRNSWRIARLLAVKVRRRKEEVRWGEEGWKRFINECGSRQAGRAGMRAVWSGLFEQQLGFGRRWLGLSTAPVLLLLAHVEAVGIR